MGLRRKNLVGLSEKIHSNNCACKERPRRGLGSNEVTCLTCQPLEYGHLHTNALDLKVPLSYEQIVKLNETYL